MKKCGRLQGEKPPQARQLRWSTKRGLSVWREKQFLLNRNLKKGAKDAERDAQGVVDAAGADTIVDHNGRKVKAGELLADAKAATAAADDAIKKKGDMAMVIDTEGRLGAKGEKQEAGVSDAGRGKKFLGRKR